MEKGAPTLLEVWWALAPGTLKRRWRSKGTAPGIQAAFCVSSGPDTGGGGGSGATRTGGRRGEEEETSALAAAAAAAVICAQASSHSCRVVKRGTGVRCGECVDVQLWKERRCDRSASGGTL